MPTTFELSDRFVMPKHRGFRIDDGWFWLLPAVAVVATIELAPWQRMCLIAFAFLAAFKLVLWRRQPEQRRTAAGWKTWAFFLAWPGLDADRFCSPARFSVQPPLRIWLASLAKAALGAVLIWGAVPRLIDDRVLSAAVVGFAGLLLLLHFGAFELLALIWRRTGIDAEPLMDRPFAATSLADFWGRRWNRSYRRMSYELFFRPLATRWGTVSGTLAAFFVSGALHELVISVPAGSGYGGPTAYFLIQAVGLLIERTALAQRLVNAHPAGGKTFAIVVVVVPLGWLFHAPFLARVIVPFLRAIGA